MASTSPRYHTEKFELLDLPQVWEEAASHVDYQLSDPEVGSYKTELGATWRSLQPITQRSYIVVAVKKAEAQIRKRPGRRMPGAAEAHMILLNNVFELLWVTPSPNAGCRAASCEKRHATPRKSPSRSQLSAVAHVDVNSTATVQPLSPAWHCIAEAGRRSSQRLRLDISACERQLSRLSPRSPVSPLARFPPVTADEADLVDEMVDHFTSHVYSDDSDTASDWSARE